MRITWYGHACFRLEGAGTHGPVTVVTDPYTPAKAGYPPVREKADVVITSSVTDDYHARHDLIPGGHAHVDALALADRGGRDRCNGLVIEAVPAAEAVLHPSGHPDRCAMYAITLDGCRVVHMGDVGNPLDGRQRDLLRDTDVLLALAGGFPTIALADLHEAIADTRPRLVIPMHFRTLTYRPRNTLWIESFLSLFDEGAVDFACAPSVEVTKDDLPEPTRVMVLDYVR